MPAILAAVEASTTLGEIAHTLRGVWGEYREYGRGRSTCAQLHSAKRFVIVDTGEAGMPIAEELKTAQELRAAGAAPALAELLAAKLETTAAATRDASFRDFQSEVKALRGDIDVRFTKMEAQNSELRASLETSMGVFMAGMIAVIGVAVAIIKLFPNWH
jgi:hypothetical protein